MTHYTLDISFCIPSIKGPPHSKEMFCEQDNSSKYLKIWIFLHVFDLKMTKKFSISEEKIIFFTFTTFQ